MGPKTNSRFLWHKFICLVAALFVVATSSLASSCPPNDCLPKTSNPATACAEMGMPTCAISLSAPFKSGCSQTVQNLAVLTAQNVNAETVTAQQVAIVPALLVAGYPIAQRIRRRPKNERSPHHAQSLLCILLI